MENASLGLMRLAVRGEKGEGMVDVVNVDGSERADWKKLELLLQFTLANTLDRKLGNGEYGRQHF